MGSDPNRTKTDLLRIVNTETSNTNGLTTVSNSCKLFEMMNCDNDDGEDGDDAADACDDDDTHAVDGHSLLNDVCRLLLATLNRNKQRWAFQY